jgi:hypothetical protein
MFLKNYTSNVPVSDTIHRIEKVLIKCQVSGITKEYGPEGKIIALHFHVPIAEGKTLTIRMPADEKAALDALWLDYADGDQHDGFKITGYPARSYKKKTKADFKEQAERTAWKLVQDWIEVQMSMIQMKQAETLQVFLPYVWDGQATFYQRLKNNGFRAMLPEKTGTV